MEHSDSSTAFAFLTSETAIAAQAINFLRFSSIFENFQNFDPILSSSFCFETVRPNG